MAGAIITTDVTARNSLGRFIKEIEMAGTYTVEDAIADGDRISTIMAPVGSRPDARSTPLKASGFHEMTSATSGRWGNFSGHALFQEKGTGPHTMEGRFKFFWESAGRMWVPGLYGPVDIINHPGNAAQPFLEPAAKVVKAKLSQIAKRYYP